MDSFARTDPWLGLDSFARTDLWVNSQSTQEVSSFRSLSTGKQGSSDLWFSKEEEANFLMSLGLENIWSSQEEDEANFLASLGLGSIGGVNSSETCSTTSTLWPEDPEPLQEAALLMEKQVEVEVGDKREGIRSISSSSSIAMPCNTSTDLGLQGKESSVSCCYDQQLGDVIITVEDENSWSMVEDQTLRLAMADYILMQPVPWERIAAVLPWRTPLEVFNRTNQLLQNIQSDLSNAMIFITEQLQQQEEQVVIMAAPNMSSREQKQLQQNQRQPRNKWSEEEHKQFLAGVERFGWGNWKMVATLLPGRTVPQVTSHAQRCLQWGLTELYAKSTSILEQFSSQLSWNQTNDVVGFRLGPDLIELLSS